MKIALRREAATGSTFIQRLFCKLIKARLVSRFCHGGVVIDGSLYHITGAHGPHTLAPGQWNPTAWVLIDVGGNDARAIELFNAFCQPPQGLFRRWVFQLTQGYDWFSLLAFVGPMVKVGWLQYCFELCWLMCKGDPPDFRVTPEILILEAIQ
jgi:hypothetical protein